MAGRLSAFKRAFRNGWQHLWRSPLLSLATLFIIALIFFVLNSVLAVSLATDSVIDRVTEKIDISAEILPDVEDYTVQALVAKLRSRPEIKEVVYIGRDEALLRFGAKYPNVIAFLENNALQNPLPGTLRIASHSLADNNKIISYLEQPEFSRIIAQEKLLKNQEQKARNERVLDITRFIRQIGFWLNFLFALVAVLIIYNSINLNIHSHEKEIHIMRLVGARHSFIQTGFLLEGVFYAVLGLALSMLASQLILSRLTINLLAIIENESVLAGLNAILVHFQDRFWITLSWQVFAAALLGLFSSYLAIRRYLKKPTSFSG